MSKPKFTLNDHQGNRYLHLNGQVVPCAFRTPYMSVHHITGEPVLNFPACGDNCQFFEVVPIAPEQGEPDKLACNLFCRGNKPRTLIVFCRGNESKTLIVEKENNNNSSILKP